MKQLGILRHAKSAWENDVPRDHDRYLAERGIKQANFLSSSISELNFIPQLTIVSSAKRTQQTWEIVRDNDFLREVNTKVEERLYLASSLDVFELLSQTPDDISKVLIIGHNPTMSEVAQQLLNDDSINFKTCNFMGVSIASNDWKLRYKQGNQDFFWKPNI